MVVDGSPSQRQRASMADPALITTAYGLNDRTDLGAATATAADWLGQPVSDEHVCGLDLPAGAWPSVGERMSAWQRAVTDGAPMLWSVRGGYGAMALAAALQREHLPSQPLLIGYSDVTALHGLYRVSNWGETIYGPMPGVTATPAAVSDLRRALSGGPLQLTSTTMPAREDAHTVAVAAAGRGCGTAVGGCLRVFAGLAGTSLMPDCRGAVLVLEDVDERPYQIDRDLTQLQLSGALDGVVGMICGRFPHAAAHAHEHGLLDRLLAEWGHRLGIPVIWGLPLGHDPALRSIVFGREIQISADAHGWVISQPGGTDYLSRWRS